jgi:hypothetical protein
MSTIETKTYHKYDWIQKGMDKTMYICTPATLIIMGDIDPKTYFIFWN